MTEEKTQITKNSDNFTNTKTDSEISNNETQEENSHFKDDEIIKLVRVRFPGNAKSFPFIVGKRSFRYGQKVVAMSDRGIAVGHINSFPYEKKFKKEMLPLRSIVREANKEDEANDREHYKKVKEAETICHKYIDEYKLDMILTHLEFVQFGKKAVFYFNAPARVDFRDLVKSLVKELKMRIELRQISVRDRTAAIGAIGICGIQTCCSSFLSNYGHVGIKMAKNQNMTLVQQKMNGICGQLKCCLKYEDEVYTEKRKLLPREGKFIQTKNGDIGKVLRLHILLEEFEMLTDKGVIKRYARTQFVGKAPEGWSFPQSFRNVTNETKDIIGGDPTKLEPKIAREYFTKEQDKKVSQEETNPPKKRSNNRNNNRRKKKPINKKD